MTVSILDTTIQTIFIKFKTKIAKRHFQMGNTPLWKSTDCHTSSIAYVLLYHSHYDLS